MEKLIEELNNFSNNKYEFMLKSATLKKAADFCVIEIFYKDGTMLSVQEKTKLEEFAVSILPKDFKYSVDFIKHYISEEKIEEDVKLFILKNCPSITYKIEKICLNDNKFEILLSIDELSFDHAKQKKLDSIMEKHFKKSYKNYEFHCELKQEVLIVEDETELQKANFVEEEVDLFAKRKIEFSNVVEIVGEKFEDVKADYIKDKTKVEETPVVVCGTIQNIKEIIIKRKPKKTEGELAEETENAEKIETEEAEKPAEEVDETKYQRKMYKFTLADFTGEIGCVFFSNKANQAAVEKLEKGSVIVVRGNLEDDKFSGGVSLRVKDIAYCSLPEKFEEHIEYRKEKPFYEFVEPEKIVTFSQDTLMDFGAVKSVPKYLQDKTFVCYDFETTGLHYVNGDKIIEIGAVKIENGKITEKFMSFVDPEKHIPEESSAISGIVDSDVKGAPTADKVLQDFYKWTRGAIIIGYNNINFDNIFLLGQGKSARFNFDNETDDVYRWAQKYVRGVKNYRLKTIADKVGVVLDNAHRAVYDALATAEIFIKIHEIFENDINLTING
ncbi:MAG: 3'-5' exoribonuclease [Clostridia bacterium]|nr:3'-5' exoribonuclease [Clostridia bacterium]